MTMTSAAVPTTAEPAAGLAAAPVGPPALSVRGLRKAFGSNVVLDAVDLDVLDGTVTAVLGPSGCGKTTLLRLVAGFEQPDEGTIAIRGAVVADGNRSLPPEHRRVGMVPQEGALFPHLSVGENVGFGLGRNRAGRARVAECLALVGLDGYERARPHQLSGGQQQRVALARALAPRPSLVVLDEPFSALDASLRAQVRDEVIAAVRAAGATAVLVTHDQQEALSVADQVAVLLDGRFAQVGTPGELYRDPADLAVAMFVGEAVLLDATLSGGVARCALGEVVTTSRPKGAEAVVVVRPEQVAIDLGGSGVAATVIGRTFYGHDALVRLLLAGGTEVTARLYATDLPPLGATVHAQVVGTVSAFPRPSGDPSEAPPR
jgi:iron(III) transport system ATP-binding protein